MNMPMIPEPTRGVNNRNVTVTLLFKLRQIGYRRVIKIRCPTVNSMTPADRKDTPPKAALVAVMEKFPEAVAKIWDLFQRSYSFQSLCEDYRDCVAAWQYWRQAASEDAPALCQSYAELLQELEQEVRQYLEQEQAPGSLSENG